MTWYRNDRAIVSVTVRIRVPALGTRLIFSSCCSPGLFASVTSEDIDIFGFQAEDGIRDVAVTGVQTCALPISVRQSMQAQVQQQVGEDARNSILTFQVMEQQRRLVLGRKAELLATLAYMRNGDPTVIREEIGRASCRERV